MSSPTVFTISATQSFVDELAAGILERYGDDPLVLSTATILLPNRRGVRALREAFLRLQGNKPLLLPSLRAIADVDDDELEAMSAGFSLNLGSITPAIPSLQRQALLTRLVERWQVPGSGLERLAPAQAWRLAADLARFLDHMHTAGVDPQRLKDLAPEHLAQHWQHTLEFLTLVTEHWPRILAELGFQDPALHRNEAIHALADHYQASPPSGPVIAAGSTGSIPATAHFLSIVARLPEGCVVLPGLDRHVADEVWDALDETHPQKSLKLLLENMGVSRHEVEDWCGTKPGDALADRSNMISSALLPSACTSNWLSDPINFESGDPFQGLSAVTALSRREEASAIAVALRGVLEVPEKTGVLVTPDRQLALHVRMALQRWGIEIDDSGGDSALNSMTGRLLALLATAVSDNFGPLSFLSLLQHPFVAAGKRRQELVKGVRRLDRLLLRGVRPAGGLAGLENRLNSLLNSGKSDITSEDVAFLSDIVALLAPLAKTLSQATNLKDALVAHIQCAEALCATADQDGASIFWRGEAGEALAHHLSDAIEFADNVQIPSVESYEALFSEVVRDVTVRPTWNKHPRLAIWGPLEARLQRADLMILGGLNEGVWPSELSVDPWMNQSMRTEFGLPPQERRIGQSAHDFVMAAGAKEVILTRSEKVDGTPTVPSRWWFRIEACAGRSIPRAKSLMSWANGLDQVDSVTPIAPPTPRPPIHARPTKLSVTQVQEWMRDPYALFAKKILDLKPLDPIDDKPNASQKGILLHEALERFLLEDGPRTGPEGLARLMAVGQKVFEPVISQPAVYAFWWPRFERIAAWFVRQYPVHDEHYETVLIEGWANGEVKLGSGEPQFTLVAKADRIDRNRVSGAYLVIDYKTGATPTEKQVEAGYAPQLPLEAWLVQTGAFENLSAGPVEDLVFWKISGGNPVQEQKRPVKDVSASVERAEKGLKTLVKVFADPDTPYLSNPKPTITGYGDYDHLARVKEWQNSEPSTNTFKEKVR
ncbi:MAG: double-strand break repair protein AddB [Kordiimonadaceae bacterium]|nr:double-strand break repair protein AddB [Kordiimonadaceae bacterium]MBO6567947.1 double-strand break repair protein AddB [Kordiimonadaceae bacterium]MBO6964323.1 double-strand break repair protein AddB [Kordiimonadaceae bacterium]